MDHSLSWQAQKGRVSLLFDIIQHATFFLVPDSKNPVEQEATKKAEYNIGPGVPSVQLHEPCSIQVQILEKAEKTLEKVD